MIEYEIRCADGLHVHGRPAEAAVHAVAEVCDLTCPNSPHAIVRVETEVIERQPSP